jgi:hypothetical protein
LVLERICPVRRGRPVLLPDFPPLESVHDVPKAMATLAASVARGEITPEEAAAVATMLEKFTAAIEVVDHAERLRAVERALEDSHATHK